MSKGNQEQIPASPGICSLCQCQATPLFLLLNMRWVFPKHLDLPLHSLPPRVCTRAHAGPVYAVVICFCTSFPHLILNLLELSLLFYPAFYVTFSVGFTTHVPIQISLSTKANNTSESRGTQFVAIVLMPLLVAFKDISARPLLRFNMAAFRKSSPAH